MWIFREPHWTGIRKKPEGGDDALENLEEALENLSTSGESAINFHSINI